MPTIHLEAEVSRESLLKAVKQLSPLELDQFVSEVLSLRAQRVPGRLTAPETELLKRINEGLPDLLQHRYHELISRRQGETLTTDEHDELLRLTDQVERLEGDRLAALADLANERGVSLSALMAELGIPPGIDG
ncbi:MAG TPA: hypothetical protein VKA15_20870 [Isosphaeraceae bacterium]|nr:hypothetical protein [Isosphaeraceae bacterium]